MATERMRFFDYNLSRWVWSGDWNFGEQAELAALPALVSIGGDRFAADGDWMEMDESRAAFPPYDDAVGDTGEDEAEPKAKVEISVFDERLWLLDYLGANPWLPAQDVSGAEGDLGKGSAGKLCKITDADASEIFDLLTAKRHDDKLEKSDFSVDLLGGEWTKELLGMEYDAFRGYAHRGEAEE